MILGFLITVVEHAANPSNVIIGFAVTLFVGVRRMSSEMPPGFTFFVGCHSAVITKPLAAEWFDYECMVEDVNTLDIVNKYCETIYLSVNFTYENGTSGV